MGRKPLLTRGLADRIVALLENGKSMQETADSVKVSFAHCGAGDRIGEQQNEYRIAAAVEASKRKRGLANEASRAGGSEPRGTFPLAGKPNPASEISEDGPVRPASIGIS